MKLDIDNNNSKEYKVKAICNSTVYTRESKSGYLLKLYYIIFSKDYLEEKSTW